MTNSKKIAYQSSKIATLDLFSSSFDELLALLQRQVLQGSEPLLVMTPNPEQIVLSRNNTYFLDHLRSADVLIPDGIGLVLASRWLSLWGAGRSIKERITGVDVMSAMLEFASARAARALIVGGKNLAPRDSKSDAYTRLDGTEIVSVTAERQRELELYWTPGFMNVKNPTQEEHQQLEEAILQLRPSMIFVAFGAPDQEAWLVKWQSVMQQAGVKVAMVVGGAPDILLGKISRAPKIFQQLGLEWLYRLWRQPWRWRRQLRLVQFVWYVIRAPWTGS